MTVVGLVFVLVGSLFFGCGIEVMIAYSKGSGFLLWLLGVGCIVAGVFIIIHGSAQTIHPTNVLVTSVTTGSSTRLNAVSSDGNVYRGITCTDSPAITCATLKLGTPVVIASGKDGGLVVKSLMPSK